MRTTKPPSTLGHQITASRIPTTNSPQLRQLHHLVPSRPLRNVVNLSLVPFLVLELFLRAHGLEIGRPCFLGRVLCEKGGTDVGELDKGLWQLAGIGGC